jgi:hypothetical protein
MLYKPLTHFPIPSKSYRDNFHLFIFNVHITVLGSIISLKIYINTQRDDLYQIYNFRDKTMP